MDVWIIFNPILKVLLYIAIFGSVGSFLFSLHFGKQLAEKQQVYCDYLAHRSTLIGAVTSLVMILSVAGNLGGDLASVIDLLMLQLAIASKPGLGYSTGFAGTVKIQGTLEDNSTNNWFDITTVTLASPTTPTYQNFNGVFNNVRFSVANDTGNTGTIDKILYRN